MISVCMIVRNEAENIATALESVKNLADEVIIVDTGSEDETLDIAKRLGATIFTGADRYHKAESRNKAIDHANGEWIIILDADEKIADPVGLREYLQMTEADAIFIRIAYKHGDETTLEYSQLRIFRKGHYEYKYRAHEVPIQLKSSVVLHTGFIWEHRPNPGRDEWKFQYTLDRLLLDRQEHPESSRVKYYLGRQYCYMKKYPEALEILLDYMNNPDHDEANACMRIAEAYGVLGQENIQIRYLFLACSVDPNTRDWYGMLAQIFHNQGKYHLSVGLLKCALEIPEPDTSYINGYWYGSNIYDLLARSLYKQEKFFEGKTFALIALEKDPTNVRLKKNLEWFNLRIGENNGCSQS